MTTIPQRSILTTILILAASISAQQVQIVTKQDNTVRAVHGVIYRDSLTGRTRCDFFSSLGHAARQTHQNGETLLVSLFPVRPDREDQITFAVGNQDPLELDTVVRVLRVRLCRDSVVVDVADAAPRLITKSPQFVLEPVLQFPRDYVGVQISAGQAKEAREMVTDLVNKLRATATLKVLSPGIYPGLPFPMVSSAVLGRRLSINRTESGYLACFEVINRDARGSVIERLRSAGQVLEGE